MNNRIKFAISIVFAFLIIIGSILTALSILKDEAVNNYITISELNAKALSKELNQDLLNIEQSILNITSIVNLYEYHENINYSLGEILEDYPQIASINILAKQKIIYSSNKYNLDLNIDKSDFFPKKQTNKLKLSTPWIGKDFIDGSSIYSYENNIDLNESFFIPISKQIKTSKGVFDVLINLNNDYFESMFTTYSQSQYVIYELIRTDGILLLSTNKKAHIGKKIKELNLLEKSIINNDFTNIEIIEGNKYFVSYISTKDYPLSLAVKLDYKKNLVSWDKKQYIFVIITILIVILSIFLALLFFYLYNKKREEEIKFHKIQIHEQEKFKLLFQDSHFLATVIDEKGTIQDINYMALKFLEKPFSYMKEKTFWDLECWSYKDKERIKKYITTNTNDKLEDEFLVFGKNQSEKFLDVSFSSITVDERRLIVVIGLDITQRKEKEKKLKQAYTVFDNTRDGIMITDKNKKLLDVNKAFENITGYKKEEVLNKRPNILKSDIHTKEFYENMWSKIFESGTWEGEITNFNKEKNYFTEWLTISAIYDDNKNLVNYIGVFSDITEQKKKEQLLQEKDNTLFQQSKQAAMGEMIGNIAHQWRQPLSIISSAATGMLLQKELRISKQEDEHKSLESINNSVQYLSQTIEDFRNFLKVDKDKKLFEVKNAIEETISLSNLDKNEFNIELVLQLKEEIKAYGIKSEFIQVVMNILKNATDILKLKENKKYIFINLYRKEQYIYIDIKDNAGGILDSIIDRVFEPYFTTKHQSQGTGIGLYMSEEIIKNHMQGRLYVKNEEFTHKQTKYKGACFTIKLPFK